MKRYLRVESRRRARVFNPRHGPDSRSDAPDAPCMAPSQPGPCSRAWCARRSLEDVKKVPGWEPATATVSRCRFKAPSSACGLLTWRRITGGPMESPRITPQCPRLSRGTVGLPLGPGRSAPLVERHGRNPASCPRAVVGNCGQTGTVNGVCKVPVW